MVKDWRNYGKTQKRYKVWPIPTGNFPFTHPVPISGKCSLSELIHIHFVARNMISIDQG